MNSSWDIFNFFSFPSCPFFFLPSCFLLCVFVLTTVWLFEDVVQHHVSGHWRTFRSQQERVYRGLLGSCVRTHTHTHKQIHTNSITHTSVKLSNSPQRVSLPQGEMPQRKKQRDGMFSLYPPLSISFSPTRAIVFSRSALCSAVQTCRVIKESGVSEVRDKMDVCRRRDEKRSSGSTAVSQTLHQTQWSLHLRGTPVDF